MRTRTTNFLLWAAIFVCAACEKIDGPWNDGQRHQPVYLEDVAKLLAEIPISSGQMEEVHDAVCASSGNGYDEEYTMRDLLANPGGGVGDENTRAGAKEYGLPLRDLLRQELERRSAGTKATYPGEESAIMDVDAYLSALETSDVQIYWPYSGQWDGETLPVVSFDPEDGAETNVGYEICVREDGSRRIREVVVTEEMAKERPVWVVNRNNDSAWTTLELLRKKDIELGGGGGNIIVGTATKAPSAPRMALVLKDFTMLRNYDSWFGGASEFFCKIGCIDDFKASTEAELRLYSPLVTDFMIVVRRTELGKKREVDTILLTNWTDQLSECAFMISEDDGGTRTSWNCSGTVKVASKSYGFEASLPYNDRDDIVWRGSLTYDYICAFSGTTGRFGDVKLTFETVEY